MTLAFKSVDGREALLQSATGQTDVGHLAFPHNSNIQVEPLYEYYPIGSLCSADPLIEPLRMAFIDRFGTMWTNKHFVRFCLEVASRAQCHCSVRTAASAYTRAHSPTHLLTCQRSLTAEMRTISSTTRVAA